MSSIDGTFYDSGWQMMDLSNAEPDIIKVKQILLSYMKDNNLEFVLNNV